MSEVNNVAVVTLLANDALEAANDQSSLASLLLIDAALTILVTRISDVPSRRELGGMLAKYIAEQIEAVGSRGAG